MREVNPRPPALSRSEAERTSTTLARKFEETLDIRPRPRAIWLAMIACTFKRVAGELMSDIDTLFVQAQTEVKQLPERPGNLTLLRLYALFKQATEGDAHGEPPGLADIAGKYKREAWAALSGTPQDVAKQRYVELVEALKSGESA
jgi:acyl-CoA-binding protein